MTHAERPPHTLSANTLFHFTGSFANLASIMNRGFEPHYSMEDLSIFADLLPPFNEIAFPMVSFCDIPLSSIRSHIATYGSFGIGLSKSWGKRRGIGPVLYTFPEATFSQALKTIIDYSVNTGLRGGNGTLSHMADLTLSYLKPYEGRQWRNNEFSSTRIRFYDEREWRFVPEMARFDLTHFFTRDMFRNPAWRAEAEAELQNVFRLEFNARDVKYIIVESESHVTQLVEAFSAPGTRFDDQERLYLTTRIVTAEQIRDDF